MFEEYKKQKVKTQGCHRYMKENYNTLIKSAMCNSKKIEIYQKIRSQ